MHEEYHNYLKYNASPKEFDDIKNPKKRAKGKITLGDWSKKVIN